MLIIDDTYIVLEMPTPVVEHVMSLRQRFSPKLLTFPVEITVAGSSGVGPIDRKEELQRVIALVSEVASQLRPFAISLRTRHNFAGSGLYYYEPEPKKVLEELHRRILDTGISFLPSEYPFTPHLTVINVNPSDSAVVHQVESLPLPNFRGIVDTMAVYSVKGRNCTLLHRVHFGGSAPLREGES